MKRTKKKAAVRITMMYIILTVGFWMFLYSYTNSYNKLTDEKIVPASLEVSVDSAELKILNHSFIFRVDAVEPDSKVYLCLYLLTPDEVRAEILAAYAVLNINDVQRS